MKTDLYVRWLLVVMILGISFGGLVYGYQLTFFILTGQVERIFGMLFIILLSVNTAFNLAGCYYYLKSYGLEGYERRELREFPPVAVVVPCRNEDPGMVDRNIASHKTLDYPKLAFYFLDNSTKPDYSRKYKDLCRKHGFQYRYVENPAKLKSYVMNKFFEDCREEYVLIFDSDERLFDSQLARDCMAELLVDGRLGFAQSSKRFAPGSVFANAVDVYYQFFYKFMQPVRSLTRSPMFCGSCGIVRKTAVTGIGGFPDSPTEDLAFAFKADLAGRGGAFISKCYAYGEPVDKFSTFLNQQWRYTIGNTWIVGEFFRNFSQMDMKKRFHYMSQTFGYVYLSYLFIFYALLTMLFVFYDVSTRSIYSNVILPEQAKTLAITYMIAIVMLTVIGARLYFGSFRLGLLAFFLNFGAAIIRARATIAALLGKRPKFVMSRQEDGRIGIIDALRHTIVETTFASVLLIFGLLSYMRSDPVSAFWLIWYSWLFFCAPLFIYSTDVGRVAPA